MKPDDRRSKLQSAGVLRARMYLKSHLGFLPGFPLTHQGAEVLWLPAAEAGAKAVAATHISTETVRRATFGWNKLDHHFPRALPRIVDDIRAWRQLAPTLLKMLGRAVHREAPLPQSLFDTSFGYSRSTVEYAQCIAREKPGLRGLLDAVSWTSCLAPDSAVKTMRWLDDNSRQLEAVLANLPGAKGLATAVLLVKIAVEDGQRRAAHILAVLGCAQGSDVPTNSGREHIEAWLKLGAEARGKRRQWEEKWPQRPAPRWFSIVLGLLEWLGGETANSRRLALDMIGMLFPDDLLPRWRDWWEQLDEQTARMRRQIVTRSDKNEACDVTARLGALRSHLPPEIPGHHRGHRMGRLRPAIAQFVQPKLEGVRVPLLRILRNVSIESDGKLLRAGIFARVADWLPCCQSGEVALVLRAIHAAGIPGERLLEFSDEVSPWELLEAPADPGRSCRAVAYWMVDLKQCGHFDWPLAVSRATTEARRIRACLQALARSQTELGELDDAPLKAAVRITTDIGDFVKTVAAAQEAHRRDYNFWTQANSLFEQFAQAGWQRLLSEALLDRDFVSLQSLAMRWDLARSLGGPPSPATWPGAVAIPDWTARFPAPLRDLLAEFAAIAPDARRIAGHLLRGDFPDEGALTEEIETIAARLAADPQNARLARRFENLRRRLATPRQMSEQRLKNLAVKIRRAIRKQVFDAWDTALRVHVEEKTRCLLRLAEMPSWLGEERHRQAFAAILRLSGWARALGLRLLRLRCGPPPWHLAGDPANVKFAARLRAMSVNPQPWLEPPGPVTRVGEDGSRVQLSFEHDPLEIFQMGAAFKTCLSPGQCNFFSTMANAADINKRVIFARDASGHLVGRCLVAIADNGGLLAFHPYCHNPELKFDAMIAATLKDLAAQMKSAVIQRGSVRPLVARGWYDDGPVDLVGQFPGLAEASPLRQELPAVELTELVNVLEREFRPLPLNSITLPMLFDLPEFEQRPELALPLLPRVREDKTLAVSVLVRAAWLAYKAGALNEAKRLLRSRIVPEVDRVPSYDNVTLGRIVEIDPSSGLRALRATRPKNVRADDREPDDRRKLIAEAYQHLGRIGKSKRLLDSDKRTHSDGNDEL